MPNPAPHPWALAHKLSEHVDSPEGRRREELLEILEAIALALVAIATA